ncbi:hypothetical protein T10_9554 [Trichinella papuae]|uniref:Uncharacterized protein n=1 Tax=Trichinella papuae TaxID=268474 RepID=A0A0V1MEG0_9BILA|nr:hypothetical protein T10_9554 [Trichinella papuae]
MQKILFNCDDLLDQSCNASVVLSKDVNVKLSSGKYAVKLLVPNLPPPPVELRSVRVPVKLGKACIRFLSPFSRTGQCFGLSIQKSIIALHMHYQSRSLKSCFVGDRKIAANSCSTKSAL